MEWSSTTGFSFSWLSIAVIVVMLGFAVRKNRLKARRRRSLRRDEAGSFIWIEVDGSPGRLRDDPLDGWDAQDAADSDGDGGD